MVSFKGVKQSVKVGLGALAFASALYSTSQAAEPAKSSAPNPTSTPQVKARGVDKDNIVSVYYPGDQKKVDYITAHDTVEKNQNTGYIVFWDKQNKILGKYDNVKGEFIPPTTSAPAKAAQPAGKPAGKPAAPKPAAPAAKPASIIEWNIFDNSDKINPLLASQNVADSVKKDVYSVKIADNEPKGKFNPSDVIQVFDVDNKKIYEGKFAVPATPTPAAPKAPGTATATPTPVPQHNKTSPFRMDLEANVLGGYSSETIAGDLFDGTRWTESHSGPSLKIRKTGARAYFDLPKNQFSIDQAHANILADLDYASGSMKSTFDSGKFSDLDMRIALQLGASRPVDRSRVYAEVGAFYGKTSDTFAYTGGTFHIARNGLGEEARVGAAINDSAKIGAVGRMITYSADQDGFKSKDSARAVGIEAEGKVAKVNAAIEAGVRTLNSRASSGQGDWKQSVVYWQLKAGQDVGHGLNVGAWLGGNYVSRPAVPYIDDKSVEGGIALDYRFNLKK